MSDWETKHKDDLPRLKRHKQPLKEVEITLIKDPTVTQGRVLLNEILVQE